jgi:hypothetical protein
MADYAPDGGWPEGPGYWGYATMYNVAMIATLESALGSDCGLSAAPGFSETGLFPIYMGGATGLSFAFADCHEGHIRAPVLFWLANKFRRPEYAAHQLANARPTPLDLLWHNAKLTTTPPALPLDKYFRYVEVVSLRGAWDDPRATFVAFKAGDNKANHSHLDIGTFALDSLGVRWGIDLGSDNYNFPGYFGKARWDYYRLRAEGHNTLVLNPGKGADQNPKAATTITKFKTNANASWCVADLTPAYNKNATSVQRGIALLNRRNVLVQDEITITEKPGDVWWFFHTHAEIKLSADAATATLTARPDKKSDPVTLTVRVLSPVGAKFQVMPAAQLPTSPQPAEQADNKDAQKLAIHLNRVTNTRIAVQFLPQDKDAAPAPPPGITALSQW